MKNIGRYIFSLLTGAAVFSSCADFDELNLDPKAANESQVKTEYLINKSISEAKQNPEIAERIFVLSWADASRQTWNYTITSGGPSFSIGSGTDDYNSLYYNNYLSAWLMSINTAIQFADKQIADGSGPAHVKNLKQSARIWRAYLMSEMTDNFGPCSINGFQGKNPEFSSEKDCYTFMLKELREATTALDLSVSFAGDNATDKAYAWDFSKWQKYGNSLRMRLAMRISNSDANPTLAQAEFEDAASKPYIKTAEDMFKIAGKNGWDCLTGVMSRTNNRFLLSSAINNLMVGLGGVTTLESIGTKYDISPSSVKADNWYGIKYDRYFTTMTNDPSAGFFFDGLHNKIDPRAYAMFQIPGNHNKNKAPFDVDYCYYRSPSCVTQKFDLLTYNDDGSKVEKPDTIKLDANRTWNAIPVGDAGSKGANNPMFTTRVGLMPCLRNNYRQETSTRVFFAAWESYFLIAEAGVKGWKTPMGAQAAYEAGIKESFAFNGQSDLVANYLTSTDYNRVGTSVSWNHTTEASDRVFNYKDGVTGEIKTHVWTKPVNTIYGLNNNDAMNKIITQKYIAQTPHLPLEAWCDHRRLGLPFFENPARENEITDIPSLTKENVKTGNSISFFPQRLKYPNDLSNSNPAGYIKAKSLLSNGKDDVFTPLWWAKKK